GPFPSRRRPASDSGDPGGRRLGRGPDVGPVAGSQPRPRGRVVAARMRLGTGARRHRSTGAGLMEIGVGRPWGDAATVYEAIGGDAAVRRLADAFYDIVEEEAPLLQAMLPANTSISRQKLYEFLSGWMGGPHLYWERRGHPALRMRHAPFPIDDGAATEWA